MKDSSPVLVKKYLLGIPIHDCTLQDLIEVLSDRIIDNKKVIVYGFSVTVLGRLKEIPELFTFWEKMDIVVADGAGIPILARLFGVRIREHVALPNVAEEMVKLAARQNFSVLLFGATQEINDKASENLRRKYPDLNVCRGINGYFNQNDEGEIVERINREKPDILLIGISSPLKERFALKYKSQLKPKVIIPCGGMIDVFAGKTKREPQFIRGLPLSWLYRFLQEPGRLFRPLLVSGLRFSLLSFPVLMLKHVARSEKNPSIKRLLFGQSAPAE